MFCLTEAPNDTDKGGGDNDAQSLRDSILRSPGDDSWSHRHRPDQGVTSLHFDCPKLNILKHNFAKELKRAIKCFICNL